MRRWLILASKIPDAVRSALRRPRWPCRPRPAQPLARGARQSLPPQGRLIQPWHRASTPVRSRALPRSNQRSFRIAADAASVAPTPAMEAVVERFEQYEHFRCGRSAGAAGPSGYAGCETQCHNQQFPDQPGPGPRHAKPDPGRGVRRCRACHGPRPGSGQGCKARQGPGKPVRSTKRAKREKPPWSRSCQRLDDQVDDALEQPSFPDPAIAARSCWPPSLVVPSPCSRSIW